MDPSLVGPFPTRKRVHVVAAYVQVALRERICIAAVRADACAPDGTDGAVCDGGINTVQPDKCNVAWGGAVWCSLVQLVMMRSSTPCSV